MRLLILSLLVLVPLSSVSYAAKTVIANEKYDKVKKEKRNGTKGYDKIVEAKSPGGTGDSSVSFMDMKRPTKNNE